jgi:hypothetical protein
VGLLKLHVADTDPLLITCDLLLSAFQYMLELVSFLFSTIQAASQLDVLGLQLLCLVVGLLDVHEQLLGKVFKL